MLRSLVGSEMCIRDRRNVPPGKEGAGDMTLRPLPSQPTAGTLPWAYDAKDLSEALNEANFNTMFPCVFVGIVDNAAGGNPEKGSVLAVNMLGQIGMVHPDGGKCCLCCHSGPRVLDCGEVENAVQLTKVSWLPDGNGAQIQMEGRGAQMAAKMPVAAATELVHAILCALCVLHGPGSMYKHVLFENIPAQFFSRPLFAGPVPDMGFWTTFAAWVSSSDTILLNMV
eukprot:TRINITY_DN17374_c0_g1_i2.p1 TRINITY_DN17374_c0_g1~~TRINITY_DN17374_c0_g1_i2.p1  ORF type:complete len:226 (+),score=39.82 TRINITY_DN17374_c0_g1_i2:123-800(+)